MRCDLELDQFATLQEQFAQLLVFSTWRLVDVQLRALRGYEPSDQRGIGSIGLAAKPQTLGVVTNPARVDHEYGVPLLGQLHRQQLVHLPGGLHSHEASRWKLPGEAIDRLRLV